MACVDCDIGMSAGAAFLACDSEMAAHCLLREIPTFGNMFIGARCRLLNGSVLANYFAMFSLEVFLEI